jgi:hypothetical protein
MTKTEIKEKLGKLKKSLENKIISDEQKESFIKPKIKELEEKLKQLEEKPEKKPKKKVVVTKKPKKETLVKKAVEKQVKPKEKKITITKKEKKETHLIATAFDKDLKDAVLTLNKARYILKEKKDPATKKTVQVKHSPEFKNSRTIIRRVEEIFDSSIHDIARTRKQKKEKKEIIDEVNEIKDLTAIWLNEVDIIINGEDKKDIEIIKKMMLALLKEAKKNDPKDKYQLDPRLKKLAEKYKL